MPKPVLIRPDAEAELTAAVDWYAERSQDTARRFCDELLTTIKAIAADPQRFPIYFEKYRYRLLKRYPYRIIYHERDADIEILAIAHTSRRPDYWKTR
jgi:plasmid stabilization system protein ParE